MFGREHRETRACSAFYRPALPPRRRGIESAIPIVMNSSTTNTTEREQWRARILRALAELDTTPPGLDREVAPPDVDAPHSSTSTG